MAELADRLRNALLASDAESAGALLNDYLMNREPLQFIDEILVKTLDDIGNGWENGEYALSQVYMSGRICEELLEGVLPDQSGLRRNKPKMAIALLNDYHSLGKKIVYSVLRAGGFQLLDYGRVEADELVERVMEERPEIIMISVLMLSSAGEIKDVVSMLRHRGSKVKIAVGGAPFRLDRQLWREVGADAVGYTASDALHIAGTFQGGNADE